MCIRDSTHSLQQFVKGTGSFVTEMADAVLNGLTNNRHSKFMAKYKAFEEKERKLREGVTSSRSNSKDETEKATTSVRVKEEPPQRSREGSATVTDKADETEQQMDVSESTADGKSDIKQDLITNEDSRDSVRSEEMSASLETEDSHDNEDSNTIDLRKPELGSLSREDSLGLLSDQASLRSSVTPGGLEEDEARDRDENEDGDNGEDEDEMETTPAPAEDLEEPILEDLEEIASTTSADSGGAVSRVTSESNSRETSPEEVEVCSICTLICVCVHCMCMC